MAKSMNEDEIYDLWDFSKIVTNGAWEPRNYLNLIIEFLHYGLNGQIENFACAVAPRLGKSMEVSEIFPAYTIGYRPYSKTILVSYADSLAKAFGSKVKDYLDSFGGIFPEHPTLSPDTKAKGFFRILDNTGEFFCTGINGSVLGHGGHYIIVDDPTKNIEEARSERHREKLIDLFNTAISTRKEKDPFTKHKAFTVVIHQRLDQNDLIGIILKNREWISAEEALPKLRRGESLGHVWVYLRLPELAEENDILGRQVGEALCPEWRDEKELEQIRTDIGEYAFNAIHQQDPKPREGKFFKKDYFDIVENMPNDIIQEVQWTDLAGTHYDDNVPISSRGASSATVRLALTSDRRLFVTFLDEMWEEGNIVQTRIIQSAQIGGKNIKYCIPQDPAQAGKGQVKNYSLTMPGYNFEGIIESGDKETRAEAPSNWAKINKIYVVNQPLADRFIDCCSRFPGGLHKDFVDALSGAFSELEIPTEPERRSGYGFLS